jgi:hypothetical protein
MNESQDPILRGTSRADDQPASATKATAEPDSTEIEIVFSPGRSLTYHYSAQPRSKVLLRAVTALACLAFIALPGLVAWGIGSGAPIMRTLSFIPIFFSVPYIFYLVYRLFTQGTQPPVGGASGKKMRLSLSFAGEGRVLAGWASGLTGIVAIISVLIEFIH